MANMEYSRQQRLDPQEMVQYLRELADQIDRGEVVPCSVTLGVTTTIEKGLEPFENPRFHGYADYTATPVKTLTLETLGPIRVETWPDRANRSRH